MDSFCIYCSFFLDVKKDKLVVQSLFFSCWLL